MRMRPTAATQGKFARHNNYPDVQAGSICHYVCSEVAPSAIEHQDELLVFSWCQGIVEDSERALELQVVHPRTIVSPQMNVVRLFCGYVS